MKLLTLKITPLSSFVTIPKGDTLFGQIVSYLYLKKDTTFDDYLEQEPKLIVSDMMPYGFVYRPHLPLECFVTEEKKSLRKKEFISIEDLQNGNLTLKSCKQVTYKHTNMVVKNSINRTTYKTDGEEFAPYSIAEINFSKKLWMFVMVDETIEDKVLATLKEIGKFGFGKEANLGKGNFEVEIVDTPIKQIETDYYMSVSPTILQGYQKAFYDTFVRFGKFGLDKAHMNAFKKPVVMAQSAAVVKTKDKVRYVGRSVNNGYEGKPSFLQGYSIAIPFKLKDESCLNIN